MNLQEELNTLLGFYDNRNREAFKKQSDFINEKFTSDEVKTVKDQFIKENLKKLTDKADHLIDKLTSYLQNMEGKKINIVSV